MKTACPLNITQANLPPSGSYTVTFETISHRDTNYPTDIRLYRLNRSNTTHRHHQNKNVMNCRHHHHPHRPPVVMMMIMKKPIRKRNLSFKMI